MFISFFYLEGCFKRMVKVLVNLDILFALYILCVVYYVIIYLCTYIMVCLLSKSFELMKSNVYIAEIMAGNHIYGYVESPFNELRISIFQNAIACHWDRRNVIAFHIYIFSIFFSFFFKKARSVVESTKVKKLFWAYSC